MPSRQPTGDRSQPGESPAEPSKSAAQAALRGRLDAIAQADALVFTSPDGTPLRHSNFYRRAWMPALEALGLEGTHFHDLRHTGNQFSAAAGANLREMMTRMGQDSPRAALIYLHASDERQRSMADQMGKNAKTALGKAKTPRSGTRVARGQVDK